MKSIRCLIIDDEPQAHEVLKAHIRATPQLEWVGSCHQSMEGMAFLREKSVDLLFLDIQMPKLLGTELVKTISRPPQIIFVTAHRDFAMDGFELGAIDYLLKPVSLERFLKAINKVIPLQMGSAQNDQQAESKKFLYFRADRKMVKVYLSEILYIESLKDYVRIFTTHGPLITKLTLTAIADMLPDDDFIQIHRSFIASRNQINAYAADRIMIGKTELPVGPLYKNLLKERMQQLRWP
jgi:DNA-binding LytR/AlgR family response regulator